MTYFWAWFNVIPMGLDDGEMDGDVVWLLGLCAAGGQLCVPLDPVDPVCFSGPGPSEHVVLTRVYSRQ